MDKSKTFFWIIALPFLLLQTWWTFAPGTGIVDSYGPVDGFTEYLGLNRGIVDFMTVTIIAAVWMISETPKERRWMAGIRWE